MSPQVLEDFASYVEECHGGTFPTSGLIFANEKGEAWNATYSWRWRETRERRP